MPFLSPAKLLVILVVALIVLGPDKLPRVARQIGGLWGDLRAFRQRVESEVRGTFPDLPSTDRIAQAVRSPLAFLDDLADSHAVSQADSREAPSHSVSDPVPDEEATVGAADGTGGPSAAPATADGPTEAPRVPGVVVAAGSGVIHHIRSAGAAVPADPGMN